jgi:hypothetical protein
VTTEENIRRRQKETNGLLVVVVVLLIVAGVYQFAVVNPNLHTEIDQNAQTKVALCALRDDLENRVAQTHQFLRHPEDFPQFSDPKTIELIRQQVEGQEHTVAALSVLSC